MGTTLSQRSWLIASLLTAGLSASSAAQPPPNADPALHQWFEGLRQPSTGESCCSISDCQILRDGQWRQRGEGYEVSISGAWFKVPPKKVLYRHDNPTGGAVLCHRGGVIFCFVGATQT